MPNQNISIKKKIYTHLLPFIRFFFSFFFNKKFLTGKFFDESLMGWHWVLRSIVWQKIFGFNRNIPWPVSPFITISDPENIEFDNNDLNNFQTYGNYFQNFGGKIRIGAGTCIAPNVGMITANHDLLDPDFYQIGDDIILGKKCWVGMNAIILPGVILGDHTVVGAGSVVTHSFPEGHVVIAGNPAKQIKNLLIE